MLPDREILTRVIRATLARGGEYADVFVEHRSLTSLSVEDSRLEKIATGSETGVGIRLIFREKTAYAYSNDLSEKALLSAASQVCRAASGTPGESLMNLEKKIPPVSFDIRLQPERVPLERKIGIVRAADAAARKHDARITQVASIYRDSVQKVQIATSEGSFSEDERVYTTAVIQVIAKDGTITQTGYESVGGLTGFEIFEKEDIEQISLKAAGRAVMMLSARKAPAGRMPVVLSSLAGGTMIHEAIGHGLEADLSQQGLSVFSGKIGQQVASPLITVIDDATMPNMRGSYAFDDEGTPAQRTVLVDRGILKGYLFDRLSAMKGHKASTGNGRRDSYHHRPIPRMSNTFISSGTSDPEEILRSVDKGILVMKMGGGQVNTVTGDFVFDVQEGYMIDKGKKGEPVRGATLTGNGPEVLMAIDMVGKDMGFSIGTCGKDAQGVPVSDGIPTLRIPEIVVGGANE